MKLSAWYGEKIAEEFPIVLQIVRDRCVYTWTIREFCEVWETVGTFPISNGKANQLLRDLEKFGLVTSELVGRELQFR